jgi:hypothetical protein
MFTQAKNRDKCTPTNIYTCIALYHVVELPSLGQYLPGASLGSKDKKIVSKFYIQIHRNLIYRVYLKYLDKLQD